ECFIDEILYRPRTEEPGVAAPVPNDLRSPPVRPEADDLPAGMDELISDAGVDEAAQQRNAGFQRQRREHPPDRLGQRERLPARIVGADAGVPCEQVDEIGHRYTKNRAGEVVFEAANQGRDVSPE